MRCRFSLLLERRCRTLISLYSGSFLSGIRRAGLPRRSRTRGIARSLKSMAIATTRAFDRVFCGAKRCLRWTTLICSTTARRLSLPQSKRLQAFDVLVLPTVPRIAPRIADLEASEAAYFEANTALLRNPSIFNFLDGCALSIPCHLPGDPPVGLMVAGLGGWDAQVLRAGLAIEAALAAREGRFARVPPPLCSGYFGRKC